MRRLALRLLLLALPALAACAAAPPAPPAAEALEAEAPGAEPAPAEVGTVTVDAEDEDLADLMNWIGDQVGVNILVDPRVEERVNTRLVSIPWREAVDLIATLCDCVVQERPGGVLLLTRRQHVVALLRGLSSHAALRALALYGEQELLITPELPDVPVDLARHGDWADLVQDLVRAQPGFVLVTGGGLWRVVRDNGAAPAAPSARQPDPSPPVELVRGYFLERLADGRVRVRPAEGEDRTWATATDPELSAALATLQTGDTLVVGLSAGEVAHLVATERR